MIASLRGTLAERSATGCVVEAGGVGYLVQVSSHTFAELPERGASVYLRTRQVVREDSIQLFGFGDAEELRLFDLLISVSGVGPRLALAVLSGLRPDALAKAIRNEQIGSLVAIPGIGRKTAERLVVELRDKLEAPPVGAGREPGVLPRSDRHQDAVAALMRLGYTGPQALEALRQVDDGDESPSLEVLVRKALALLGKGAVLSR